MGFLGSEHRILVRQIDAAHTARRELGTHGLRFLAIANQDRDIRGKQPSEILAVPHKPGPTLLPTVEQCGDFAGTRGSQLLSIHRAGQWLLGRQVPNVERGHDLTVDVQKLFAPLGLDGQKRHRVIAIALTEQEGSAPGFASLGAFKHMVHGADHAVTGSEVGAQRMQATRSRLTGAQVGIDVGAAEGVDRLLRITDQEQAALGIVVFDAIDALEDPVLHRVGVLEFVDQRHRKLFADQGRQALATIGLQSRIEA
ncbi:hypothetical protein D3C87_1035610 [compost metagenome]